MNLHIFTQALVSALFMPVVMGVFFPVCIQIMRGGWWVVLLPLVCVFGVIDIVANYTVLAIATLDLPQAGEYTFSKRLERLCLRSDWRGDVARRVGYCLNAATPNYDHIINANFFRLTAK